MPFLFALTRPNSSNKIGQKFVSFAKVLYLCNRMRLSGSIITEL